MLEGARHAVAGDLARGLPVDPLAEEEHLAACHAQHARDQVEGRGLAGTVGPDQADDLAGADLEADVIDRHQAAELLADGLHVEHQLARGGLAALRQRCRIAPVVAALAARQFFLDHGPQAIGHVLEYQHQGHTEDDDLVAAAGADELGQQYLQLVVQQFDEAGTHQRAPHVGHAADHRHEQVLDAHLQAESSGTDRALEVRKQPARQRCQQGRQQEHGHLVAEGVDAHGFGHLRAVLQRADGSARAGVQQVQHRRGGQQQDGPGQQEETTSLAEIQLTERQRLDAGDAVVFAQRVQIAHQVIERQAPGDGGQRQVVARHAQRDQREDQRGHAREEQAQRQCQPG